MQPSNNPHKTTFHPKGPEQGKNHTSSKTSVKNSEERLDQAAKKKRFIIFLIVSAAIAILIVVTCIFVPLAFNSSPGEALIRIPKDASREMVKDSIAKYLGDDFASSVITASRIQGHSFSKRHGAYMIEKEMSPLQAERRLSKGAQHPLTVTINGFKTVGSLADKVALKLDLPKDTLLKYLNDESITSKYGLTPKNIGALFIEDSYQFYWNVSPVDFIDKIGKHYLEIWNEERVNKARDLGLTPAQVMIVASITDEESNKKDEKGNIGRLYINRLNKGIKLQADPTVKFALGDFSIRRIRNNHLTVDSPFNTYKYAGLPPGPIRTTSVATIDSILKSRPHSYLYMCAKDDFSGYHSFATTYPEHLQNARRYQQALNRRGIK